MLIVDDEALARDRLRDLIAEHDTMRIVGECERGDLAVDAIATLAPDIVLLDIQMPGMDGFEVLEAVHDVAPVERLPAVIFVTAYDDYAIRAFEANALDYLQKPVARTRLAQSLERAVRHLDLHALRSARQMVRGYTTRFAVRRADIVHFVRAEAVDWIDAAGNYVRLHAGGTAYLVRGTMGDIESRLDPRHFARVHRSAIVNLNRIARIEPYTHGEYVIIVADGARVRSSRAYSARLRDLIHTGME